MLSLYIQWIALGSSATLCLIKPLLKARTAGASGLIALSNLLLVTALVSAVSFSLVIRDNESTGFIEFMLQSLSISFIIGIMSLHYFYMQYRLAQQQQAESDAKFQALQARIRPHFLFNSMNTIAHLTRADPEMAEQVVENLADLFRATLDDPGKLSTLGEEIELARGYLQIESMRLGPRLQTSWQVDDTLMSIRMPSMMLQPLLENAVYHGIEPSAEGGQIRIDVLRQDHNAVIKISNTVNPEIQRIKRNGNRMAQENTRQRLLAFYGEEARFEISDADNLYIIRMTFPVSS